MKRGYVSIMNNDSNELKYKLQDKAYDEFFLQKEITVRCPKCNGLVEGYEIGSCYGLKCKCGYMDDAVRGL